MNAITSLRYILLPPYHHYYKKKGPRHTTTEKEKRNTTHSPLYERVFLLAICEDLHLPFIKIKIGGTYFGNGMLLLYSNIYVTGTHTLLAMKSKERGTYISSHFIFNE